jgi:hypothetical protein
LKKLLVWQAAVQALAREDADFDLGNPAPQDLGSPCTKCCRGRRQIENRLGQSRFVDAIQTSVLLRQLAVCSLEGVVEEVHQRTFSQ